MADGRLEGYRETLMLLGRAAGLSALALATIGSGPCGGCTDDGGDECATLSDLVATRDAGVANPPSTSLGGSSADAGGEGGEGGEAGTGGMSVSKLAIAKAWDGVSCPTPTQYQAIVELKFPGRYSNASISTKDLNNDQCCYWILRGYCDDKGGRPFLVRGERRLTSVTRAAAVTPNAPADAWLVDARLEHASVAAFARLSLQLMSLGAPAELVRDAQLASLDELRHADFFFELASREAGQKLEPGALDVSGALDDLSLAGLIEANLLEGCIGETLAAEELRQRARRSRDATLAAALQRIADDETRHAELAFRVLRWCRDTAPELTREVLQRVLAEAAPARSQNEGWQRVLSPLFGALATT